MKEKGLSKRTVTILVILAIVFVCLAIAYNYFDLNKKIPTDFGERSGSEEDSSGGKVGIVIAPPEIEDKGSVDNVSG
ncbi:MAG: hypothetical protein WCX73_02355 [Candidatus Pacearchaeota archaeon]|jgi:hypothetical protein